MCILFSTNVVILIEEEEGEAEYKQVKEQEKNEEDNERKAGKNEKYKNNNKRERKKRNNETEKRLSSPSLAPDTPRAPEENVTLPPFRQLIPRHRSPSRLPSVGRPVDPRGRRGVTPFHAMSFLSASCYSCLREIDVVLHILETREGVGGEEMGRGDLGKGGRRELRGISGRVFCILPCYL